MKFLVFKCPVTKVMLIMLHVSFYANQQFIFALFIRRVNILISVCLYKLDQSNLTFNIIKTHHFINHNSALWIKTELKSEALQDSHPNKIHQKYCKLNFPHKLLLCLWAIKWLFLLLLFEHSNNQCACLLQICVFGLIMKSVMLVSKKCVY